MAASSRRSSGDDLHTAGGWPMDTTSPPVTPGKKRRLLAWLGRGVLVLICVLGVAYLIYRLWMESVAAQGQQELARAIEETDAASPGWRWEEILAARKPVAPGEDSWPVIEAVCQAGAVLLPIGRMADEPPWVDPAAPNRLLP